MNKQNYKSNSNYESFHEETSYQKYLIDQNNFTYKIVLGVLNKYLIPKRKNILDIGCGAGTICYYLADKGYNVMGIDISQNAIDVCNKSAEILGLKKNLLFKKMNYPDESPSGKFDSVLCLEVIEHLTDDKLAVKKIFLLLKPGGVAIISTPSKNAPLYRFGYAREFDKRVGHLRRYTVQELTKMFIDEGFEILEIKRTEGIIRNFLFLNPFAGKIIRFIKFFIVDIVSFIDQLSLVLFGESDLFIVVRKK